MGPMRAFTDFTKMAKIAPADLLTLNMVLIEPTRKNEQNTVLVL